MATLWALVLVMYLEVLEIVTSISMLLRVLVQLLRTSAVLLIPLVIIASHVIH
jgi:hypothetical protein